MDGIWAQRWSRQILLPEIGVSGQDRLCRSSVLIGGGAGSDLLKVYLTACGIGSVNRFTRFTTTRRTVVGIVGTPQEVRPLIHGIPSDHPGFVWAVVLRNTWMRGHDWRDEPTSSLSIRFSPDPAEILTAACWVATRMILTLCGGPADRGPVWGHQFGSSKT